MHGKHRRPDSRGATSGRSYGHAYRGLPQTAGMPTSDTVSAGLDRQAQRLGRTIYIWPQTAEAML